MACVQLTLVVTVELSRTDVNGLEEQLLRERARLFRQVMVEVAGQLEAQALAQPVRCTDCGGRWRHNGRKVRVLETLLGRIEVRRVRLRCEGCGAERYPLDEALSLVPGEKHTLGVQERALWAATEVSYGKAEAFLAKFAGLAVARGTIHRMAHAEGARLLAQDETERAAVFERGAAPPAGATRPALVVVQVDGTGVRDRSTHVSMGTKVGVVYTGVAEVSRNRRELVGKRCVASFGTAERFGELLWLEAARCGVREAEQVVFISDGEAWIPKVQRMHFPEALGVLDRWHLERALRETLWRTPRSIAPLLGMAQAGDPESMKRRLRDLVRRATAPEDCEARANLLAYVTTNAEGIRNLPRAPLVGSGAIEKQVDIVVCRRLKTRGMSWYRERAGTLQRLRVLKLNGDWAAHWERRAAEQAHYVA
jgi:hypothetical protein